MKKTRIFFTTVVTFIAINIVVSQIDFKNYGGLTGYRYLEDSYAKFQNQKYDTIVLGSSLGALGFNSKYYQKLNGEKVFNFSSPGSGFYEWYLSYLLIRSHDIPKKVIFIYIPPLKPGSETDLTRQISKSPISYGIRFPVLIKPLIIIYKIPVLKNSKAILDRILYGNEKNYTDYGSDLYYKNQQGDLFSAFQYSSVSKIDSLRREMIQKNLDPSNYIVDIDNSKFLPKPERKAMLKLSSLLKQDKVQVELVYLDIVSRQQLNKDSQISSKRANKFLNYLEKNLETNKVHNLLDKFTFQDYEILDDTHWNLYGANKIIDSMNNKATFEYLSNLEDSEGNFDVLFKVPKKTSEFNTISCEFLVNRVTKIIPRDELRAKIIRNGNVIYDRKIKWVNNGFEIRFLNSSSSNQFIHKLQFYTNVGDNKNTFNSPVKSCSVNGQDLNDI
jgi:hypothetical protein